MKHSFTIVKYLPLPHSAVGWLFYSLAFYFFDNVERRLSARRKHTASLLRTNRDRNRYSDKHFFVMTKLTPVQTYGERCVGETRQFTDKTIHRHGFWRQFTDSFEDSSPTLLKTVHRHFFYHVIDIWLENIIDYCEEILMSYDLRWYVDIICWEKRYFVCLINDYSCIEIYLYSCLHPLSNEWKSMFKSGDSRAVWTWVWTWKYLK